MPTRILAWAVAVLAAGCFSSTTPEFTPDDPPPPREDPPDDPPLPDAGVDRPGCEGLEILESNREVGGVSSRVPPDGRYVYGELYFALEDHYFWHDTYEVSLRAMGLAGEETGEVPTYDVEEPDAYVTYSHDWDDDSVHAIAIGESHHFDGAIMVATVVDEYGRGMALPQRGIFWYATVPGTGLRTTGFSAVADDLEVLSLDIRHFDAPIAIVRSRETRQVSFVDVPLDGSAVTPLPVDIRPGEDYRVVAPEDGPPRIARLTNLDWPWTVTVAGQAEPSVWHDDHYTPGCGVEAWDIEAGRSVPDFAAVAQCGGLIALARYARDPGLTDNIVVATEVPVTGAAPQVAITAGYTAVAYWDDRIDGARAHLFDVDGTPVGDLVIPGAMLGGEVAHMELVAEPSEREWALLVVRHPIDPGGGPVTHLTRFARCDGRS